MVLRFQRVISILSPQRTRPDALGVTHWLQQPHRRSITAPSLETIASLPGFMLAFKEPVAYCRVWVPTDEQGRQSYAWSGCLSIRSHRRDYGDCRPAPARARPL